MFEAIELKLNRPDVFVREIIFIAMIQLKIINACYSTPWCEVVSSSLIPIDPLR